MSRPRHADVDPAAQPAPPVPSAVGSSQAVQRGPLPVAAMAKVTSIRLRALGVSAFLLPRVKFHALHYSLRHFIASWDGVRYLNIAAHGCSYVPVDLRRIIPAGIAPM
jgi:hypothetical protein